MFAENLACDFNHFKFRFSPGLTRDVYLYIYNVHGLTENYECTGHNLKLALSVISDL